MIDQIDRTVPSIAGKVALVTGSGGVGMGRATAELFALSGARVAVIDIDEAGGQETVDRIRRAGGKATFIFADVTQEASTREMVERAISTFGRLDCAVNHVGSTGGPKPLGEVSLEEYDSTQSICARSAFLCMKAELPVMLAQGRGAIVQTASEAGVQPRPGLAAYAGAKHAVVGMCQTAASDYGRQGIRINVVAPGATRSEGYETWLNDPELGASLRAEAAVFAMGRPCEPIEVASAIVWLCSDAASYVNGAVLQLDGGTKLRAGG